MAKVLMWRLAYVLAAGLGAVMAALIWLPSRVLGAMCTAMDEAEVSWILACSERRLAERLRVNQRAVVRPLPGADHDRG